MKIFILYSLIYVPFQDSLATQSSISRITINISGTLYETYDNTLRRFPNTLLGCPLRRGCFYDPNRDQFFFNRSRKAFDAILFYYQSNGCLVRPLDVPMREFESECIFFGLGVTAIRRMKSREGFDPEKTFQAVHDKPQSCRETVWNFMENPETSTQATVFQMLSIVAIIFTIALDCIETIPDFLQRTRGSKLLSDPWKSAKFGLNIFFAVEYLVRFASSPSKIRFLRSPGNIVDIAAIAPMFVAPFLDQEQYTSLLFIRILRTLRILRMFRLSKQSQLLSVVLHILSESLSDLFMLVFCMLISCVVFGSLTFYMETATPGTPFHSVLDGMWFAIETVVSIGYGDIVPISASGKLAGAVTAVFGALTMTVPLLSLGGRYFSIYTKTYSVVLGPDIIGTPPSSKLAKMIENAENKQGLIYMPRPIRYGKMPSRVQVTPTRLKYPWQLNRSPSLKIK